MVVINLFFTTINSFYRIMLMTIPVAHITIVFIKASVQRMTGPFITIIAVPGIPLKAPFPYSNSLISGLLQYIGHSIVVFQSFVKLVIAHIAMALMHAK